MESCFSVDIGLVIGVLGMEDATEEEAIDGGEDDFDRFPWTDTVRGLVGVDKNDGSDSLDSFESLDFCAFRGFE